MKKVLLFLLVLIVGFGIGARFWPQFWPQNQNQEQTSQNIVSEESVVTANDGQKYNVINIYRDPANDLASLKIDATELQPLSLGDSSNLELGQMAIAIGTPLGQFQNTLTVGVILVF